MKIGKLATAAMTAAVIANVALAAPDSSIEVSTEFSDRNVFTLGYGMSKIEIDGVKVADFGDSHDAYFTQKVSLMSDDFSETFLKWKIGFTFNDDIKDVFHAGVGFGFSSTLTEDSEDIGWFATVMAEYFNGADDQTFYSMDIGMNFKIHSKNDKSVWFTPFVGMIADDDFNDVEGSYGGMLTFTVMENGAVSVKYSGNDYQDTFGISFSYAY
jgi:hypothetical protein